MSVWRSFTCLAGLLLAGTAIGNGALPFSNSEACMQGPLAEFGRYIGDWRIEDETLSRDTLEWEAGKGARWIFTCLGDGTAVQDFWLPPDGSVGTNLRIYDPDSETWEITWAINTAPGMSHIRAKLNDAGNIIMKYVAPLPNPLRRITFFPPDDDGWNWRLEFSWDDGANWTEVYRIKATPYQDDA
ncbi:MAG: hypothetical protein KJO82_01860 [Gammaproteobacteria bacterium]|nr:hypothetical protein [Gammaproteobacteria bacterium]